MKTNAFEKTQRIPVFRGEVPIMGMEKFINKDKALQQLFCNGKRMYWHRTQQRMMRRAIYMQFTWGVMT